jgi:hypothetical protein
MCGYGLIVEGRCLAWGLKSNDHGLEMVGRGFEGEGTRTQDLANMAGLGFRVGV